MIYSGTVSAATEGTVLGIPSLAVSLTTYGPPDFRYAAKFARKMVLLVAEKGLPHGTLLNINIPAVPEKKIRGVRVTRQGRATWDDRFDVRRDPANKQYFWLTGVLEDVDHSRDADHRAIKERYVSITPIHFDLTNYDMIDQVKQWGVERLR